MISQTTNTEVVMLDRLLPGVDVYSLPDASTFAKSVEGLRLHHLRAKF